MIKRAAEKVHLVQARGPIASLEARIATQRHLIGRLTLFGADTWYAEAVLRDLQETLSVLREKQRRAGVRESE
jgi:hypothetical protein